MYKQQANQLIMGQYDPKFEVCYLHPYVLDTYDFAQCRSGVVEFLFHFIGKAQFRQAMLSCDSSLLLLLFFYIFMPQHAEGSSWAYSILP